MPCVEGSGPPNLVFYDRVPDLLVKMVMVPMEALSMLKHVHLIFLAHGSDSERTFQMQGCMASEMNRFLTLLNVHHRHKRRMDFSNKLTECYSKPWDLAVRK